MKKCFVYLMIAFLILWIVSEEKKEMLSYQAPILTKANNGLKSILQDAATSSYNEAASNGGRIYYIVDENQKVVDEFAVQEGEDIGKAYFNLIADSLVEPEFDTKGKLSEAGFTNYILDLREKFLTFLEEKNVEEKADAMVATIVRFSDIIVNDYSIGGMTLSDMNEKVQIKAMECLLKMDEELKKIDPDYLEKVEDGSKETAKTIKNALARAREELPKKAPDVWNAFKEQVSKNKEEVTNLITGAYEKGKEYLEEHDLKEEAKNSFQNLVDKVENSKAYQKGKEALDNSKLVEKGKDVFEKAKEKVEENGAFQFYKGLMDGKDYRTSLNDVLEK